MRRSTAGFTLLEVVAVMAIVAILATLALPSPSRATSRRSAEQAAMRIASMLKADRYAAMRSHAAIVTTVDLRAGEIRAGSSTRRYQAPSDLTLEASVSARCRSTEGGVGIVFYPDGQSCGGSLTLQRPGLAYEIRINWLTGGIVLVEG